MAKVDVTYKVKFGESKDVPLSIARKMVGDDMCVVESCNQYNGWTSKPELISMWIGSPDGAWHSAPEGQDMPIEFIENWIDKWKSNWV